MSREVEKICGQGMEGAREQDERLRSGGRLGLEAECRHASEAMGHGQTGWPVRPCTGCALTSFHLMATLEAHQKLAT